MKGDQHTLSTQLMTEEGGFELSVNHSSYLLQKFLTHLHDFGSEGSPCQLLLLSEGRSHQVVRSHVVLCCSQQLASGLFFPEAQ